MSVVGHPGKYIDKTQLIELIAKASKIFPCRKRHRWHKLIRKKLYNFVNLYHWYVEENATNAFNQVSWFIVFKIITWVTNKLWYCSSSTLTLRPCSDSVVYERQRSEKTVNYFITGHWSDAGVCCNQSNFYVIVMCDVDYANIANVFIIYTI